jgi:DNA-binding transcriptional ArsR family regulator
MDLYHERANLLKAMAHPVRLQIIDLLRRDAECVCHLSAALRKPQPYISQQLAVLRSAGVIIDEKNGSNVFYRLADEQIARQADATLGALPELRMTGPGSHRQKVKGCNCPKCEPGGTCAPRA